MTASSAILWTRAAAAGSVTPELSETPGFERPLALPPVQASPAHDLTVKTEARDLKPGAAYYYRFKAGGATSPIGSFKTAFAPSQDVPVTMGFSGDADWKWRPFPILSSLAREQLDYFFFLGDLIYEDTGRSTSAETLDDFRFKYRENREPRDSSASKITPLQDLYKAFGMYGVYDNHEAGTSRNPAAPPYTQGGAARGSQFVNQTPGFKDRLQALLEYQPFREDVVSGSGDRRLDGTTRFYRAVPWGANTELIALDDRTYRDEVTGEGGTPETEDCSRTMLGPPQLKWFRDALLSAKQRKVVWKLVVVSSPIQQLGKRSQIDAAIDGPKSWTGGFVCERDRLLKFIDDNAIDNVVFLTTDNHYTVINNLKYNATPGNTRSGLKPARNAFEILVGPLGAGAGNPFGLKVRTTNASRRENDRTILGVWNGELPNTDGQVKGLKQAGLDPIGLEADFPGLVASSIRADGVRAGSVEPLAFASFNTYSYAVLTLDRATLTVRVKGFPIVPDPSVLDNPPVEAEYEGRVAQDILSFQLKAQ